MSETETCPSCGALLGRSVWQQYATDGPVELRPIGSPPAPVTLVTTCRRWQCIASVPNRIPEDGEPRPPTVAEAFNGYRWALRTSGASLIGRPHPGDWVIETSSRDDADESRLGRLVRFQTVAYDREGSRVIEHQAVLELPSGRETTWSNCVFARIVAIGHRLPDPCTVPACPYCAAGGDPSRAPGGDWDPDGDAAGSPAAVPAAPAAAVGEPFEVLEGFAPTGSPGRR